MVRPPRFDSNGIKSGVWSKEEDDTLRAFVQKHGHRNWQKLPLLAGLARSGKSCRLRWVNYLQPGLKKDNFTKAEVDLIITLHNQFGNKWSAIADHLPGRTDNDIKNHWHAHIKKRGKRCRLVNGAEMGDEEQSFDQINCCEKNNDQEETAAFNVDVHSQAENNNAEAAYDHEFLSMDLPPFQEEEFNSFGLRHNGSTASTFSDSSYDDHACFSQHNYAHLPSFPDEEFFDMAAFSDSSNGGITYDDRTCFSQLDLDLPPLISEEEFCAFRRLCHNDTPTFSDSSDAGGITSSNQMEVLGLSQLERAWYFGDNV